MLFTSPKYSSLAKINLMNLVSCKTMLIPEERSPVVDSMLEEHRMRLLQFPRLDEPLGQTHPNYPVNKNFEDARHEPLVVLHTSGTVGFLKPIIRTHDRATNFGKQRFSTHLLGLSSPMTYC